MDYEEFFGFKDTPFRLTPDPDYYFPSAVHQEALQTLLYSIRAREGFIQVTGDPGTGKTLTLRTLLNQLNDDVHTALILNPRLSPQELLKAILEDLGLDPVEIKEKDKEELLRFFRDFLLEKTQKDTTTVVIIDEAQNLPDDTLEELRLLSNLETEKRKLLQIILVGQVELENKLKSSKFLQLNQRITIRCKLKHLSKSDTIYYIQHRLRVAGDQQASRFSHKVLEEVYTASRGVPRLINIICERALMSAFVDGKNFIERSHLKKALQSISGEKKERFRPLNVSRQVIVSVALTALVMMVVFLSYNFYPVIRNAWSPQTPDTSEISNHQNLTSSPMPQAAAANDITTRQTASTSNGNDIKSNENGRDVNETITESPVKTEITTEIHEPRIPKPPEAVINLPKRQPFLAVDSTNRTAILWEKTNGQPVIKGEFKWPNPPREGIYLLAESDQQEILFLSPNNFENISTLPDIDTVLEAFNLMSSHVIPVIVHSRGDQSHPPDPGLVMAVTSFLRLWAGSWQNKDLSSYSSFYADPVISYSEGNSKPTVLSRQRLRREKEDVFQRSGPISVTISDPLIVVNPVNPDRIFVLFHQKYDSDVYSDEGTKGLYLQRSNGKDLKIPWKIKSRFWVPLTTGKPNN